MRSIRPTPLLAAAWLGSLAPAAAQSSSAQFEAQRQQRYEYSTFSALSAPVVLPTDGTLDAHDWLTGLDVSLADKIFPHAHLDTAVGTSSRHPQEWRVGHHDPIRRDGVTIQNLEFSLSGRLDEHNEFFITYAGAVDADDEIDPTFEEAFWKLKNLPGGFEIRGGRFYNRFGIHNTYHPHGFDWVDQYLMSGRLLGHDPLTTIGAEVSWRAPLPWVSQFDVAVGEPPEHEDEAGAPFGGQYNPEESHIADDIVAANWTNVINYNDFHQFRAGASGAWGENHAGYQTSIYGFHFEYQWRENGFDPGGRYFRVRSEAMFSRYKVEDELGIDLNPVTQQDFGCYVSALYGFSNSLEVGARAEYVPGNGETQQDARFRFSPGVTWYANPARTVRFRLQYNCDHSNVFGTDHGIWGQVSLAWGGPEVR